MKNIFISYFFFIFLLCMPIVLSLSPYIKLPVYSHHTTPPKSNETTKMSYYKYFHDNNIYTILEIGSPSQKIVAKLNMEEFSFFIYYNRCDIPSSFDLNSSQTYTKSPFQNLLTDIYVYTYLINDTFYFYDINSNKYTYNLTYLFSPVNKDSSEQKIEKYPYTCADLGLKLAKPETKAYNFNYNFIMELKLSEAINEYSFFIEYNNNKDNSNNEGNLIIGVEPYVYNKGKYKLSQLREIESVMYDLNLYWQLKFNEIYFNINNSRIDLPILDVGLNHNLNIIIAPVDYMEIIQEEFFNKGQRNCRRNRLENNFYNFDCDSLKDLENFPTIFFLHRTLGKTFEVNAQDIFVEYDGKYISLIWIDMRYRNNWRMGKPFLKKYFFSFNEDKKIIGFYDLKNIDNDKESKVNLRNVIYLIVIIVLLLFIGILAFVFAKIFYTIKKPKKRANLLEDTTDNPINE